MYFKMWSDPAKTPCGDQFYYRPLAELLLRHLIQYSKSPFLRPKDLHSFSNPSYETEGEKTKTLKKIPLPGEIPSLKESEIGFIPKGVPTITGNQSGQATGHGCRPLTRKLCSTLTKNQNPGPWITQRNRRTHQCSRSLFYSLSTIPRWF